MLLSHTMKRADEVVVHLAGPDQNDLLAKGYVMAASQPNSDSRAKQRRWTPDELKVLREQYPQIGKARTAELLGRPEGQVRTKASSLGIKIDRNSAFFKDFQSRAAKSKVGKKRPEQAAVMLRTHAEGKFTFSEQRRAAMSARHKIWLETHKHPRGALGMKHSKETLAKLSAASLAMWNRLTPQQKLARKAKLIRTRAEKGNLVGSHARGTWKAEWREIGGRRLFFRSRWEANYARYLEQQKQQGLIADWQHECQSFFFPADLFGESSYLPDFCVTYSNGRCEYHEVKGWMDARSKAQVANMQAHYPDVVLKVIDAKAYKKLDRQYRWVMDGWEHTTKTRRQRRSR